MTICEVTHNKVTNTTNYDIIFIYISFFICGERGLKNKKKKNFYYQ